MKFFKILLLFTVLGMCYSLWFFPFWFHFTDQAGWGFWFIIPFVFSPWLLYVIKEKGCWFFQN